MERGCKLLVFFFFFFIFFFLVPLNVCHKLLMVSQEQLPVESIDTKQVGA